METINTIASTAVKAVWGDPEVSKEPVSGAQGDVASGEPYDAGNMDPARQKELEDKMDSNNSNPNFRSADNFDSRGISGDDSQGNYNVGSGTGFNNQDTLGDRNSNLNVGSGDGFNNQDTLGGRGSNLNADSRSGFNNQDTLGDRNSNLNVGSGDGFNNQDTLGDRGSNLNAGSGDGFNSHNALQDRGNKFNAGSGDGFNNQDTLGDRNNSSRDNFNSDNSDRDVRSGDGFNNQGTTVGRNNDSTDQNAQTSRSEAVRDDPNAEDPAHDPKAKNRANDGEEVKVTGDGPRPLEAVAREYGGDAGNKKADGSSSRDQSASSDKKAHDGDDDVDEESKGTGELYVKTSGLAADGGDFDATKPGAGREADRLMEEKGLSREDGKATGKLDSNQDDSDKPSLGERIKNKLHMH